jgi:mannose-6-phosphate isomerase-like protein (cupin superfamily)
LVKRIYVNPGERTSLQRHERRSEKWVVVHGQGDATLGAYGAMPGNVRTLLPGDVIFVEKGRWHRLRCTGTEPLCVIEVWKGHSSEADIERQEDDYGRVA